MAAQAAIAASIVIASVAWYLVKDSPDEGGRPKRYAHYVDKDGNLIEYECTYAGFLSLVGNVPKTGKSKVLLQHLLNRGIHYRECTFCNAMHPITDFIQEFDRKNKVATDGFKTFCKKYQRMRDLRDVHGRDEEWWYNEQLDLNNGLCHACNQKEELFRKENIVMANENGGFQIEEYERPHNLCIGHNHETGADRVSRYRTVSR